MAQNATDAFPAKAAPPSPGGRNLRSSGRTLRSNSEGARLISLDDIQKKSPAKKKQKKERKKAEPKDKAKKSAEGEGASGTTGSGGGADPKGKGKKAAVPEGGDSDAADEPEDEDDDPNRTVIVVEHCTQCKSFLRRATEVKDGLEGSQAIDVVVKLNPEKPRRGCFEIRQQGGQTFISLLDMERPFKQMKDLDMGTLISDISAHLSIDAKPNLEKPRTWQLRFPCPDLQPYPKIIFVYGYDSVFEGGISHISLAVRPFPFTADRFDSPMGAGFPIGRTEFINTVRGFSFVVGDTFHRVANLGMGLLSNVTQVPLIDDPSLFHVEYKFGYDSIHQRYKIAQFSRYTHIFGQGTRIKVHTLGVDRDWRKLRRRSEFRLLLDGATTYPNEGILVMDGGVCTASFLGTVRDYDRDIDREGVLTFNFSTERHQTFPIPNARGDPVLCCLRNRLCCSFYNEPVLNIFQVLPDNTWEITIQIDVFPILGVPIDFFPIDIQGSKLLIAYICWHNEDAEADFPPDFPLHPQNFYDIEHGLLVDTAAGTVQIIDSFPFNWFYARSIVEWEEPLPY